MVFHLSIWGRALYNFPGGILARADRPMTAFFWVWPILASHHLWSPYPALVLRRVGGICVLGALLSN